VKDFKMHTLYSTSQKKQHGAAAVEFALICLIFFSILFAILELGRMMYVYNTMQEVTRRAARAAVVRWVNEEAAIKSIALFGGTSIPAGPEVTAVNIKIEYLNEAGGTAFPRPDDPPDNLSACNDLGRVDSCIYSVRVSIVAADGTALKYSPMVSLFSTLFNNANLYKATVTMHAESLGFEI
jgi:TadE-like protein